MSPATRPDARSSVVLVLAALGLSAAAHGCTEERVTGVDIASISVLPEEVDAVEGEAVVLSATARDDRGSTLPVGFVTWTSRDEDVATVDPDGTVRARGPGPTWIVASLDGVSDSTAVLVREPGRLVVSPASVALHAASGAGAAASGTLQVAHDGADALDELTVRVTHPDGAPSGWLSAQAEGDRTPTSVTVTADGGGLAAGVYEATVSITSPDAPDGPVSVSVTFTLGGLDVSETGGASSVTEGGGTDRVDVVLPSEPRSDVVVAVSTDDAGEVRVDPARLTFTPGTWDEVQSVSLTGVDDNVVDGDRVTAVTLSVVPSESDDAFDDLPPHVVDVTTVDDDASGLGVAETGSGTSVGEGGSSDAVSVSLESAPTSDVVVTVTSDDVGEVSVEPGTLTFTPSDWGVERPVTVRGVDDDVVDGDQVTRIVVSVDPAASDDAFDDLPSRTVEATTTDDDTAGFTVTESGGSTVVSEADGATNTDDLAVALDAAPSSDVVLRVSSGDPGEATVSPTSLTFTPTDWSTPRTVTVTGTDDTVVDGDQVGTISVSVDAAASDDAFDDLPDRTVEVTTTDDEAGGFRVTETGAGTTVSEGGGTDSLEVALVTTPVSDVVLELTVTDPGEATASPARLTFTPADGTAPRTVTVTGVDDEVVDGDQVGAIVISVDATASDDAFDNLPDRTVEVTTTDDDTDDPPTAEIVITESGGDTRATEAGGTDSFTVALGAAPSSSVVITVASRRPLEAIVTSAATLTFTQLDWSVPQTVSVAAVDDILPDGDQVTGITVAVSDLLSDDAYDGLVSIVSVTTIDNDGGLP